MLPCDRVPRCLSITGRPATTTAVLSQCLTHLFNVHWIRVIDVLYGVIPIALPGCGEHESPLSHRRLRRSTPDTASIGERKHDSVRCREDCAGLLRSKEPR